MPHTRGKNGIKCLICDIQKVSTTIRFPTLVLVFESLFLFQTSEFKQSVFINSTLDFI